MASVHEYKRLENSIIKKLKNSVVIAGHGIVRALQAIGSFLTRRYTVVFVPHSEKKVYNFQITVVSVFLFLLVTGGIVGAFFWYSASYSSTRSVLAGKDNRLREVQASLEQLRDERRRCCRRRGILRKPLTTLFPRWVPVIIPRSRRAAIWVLSLTFGRLLRECCRKLTISNGFPGTSVRRQGRLKNLERCTVPKAPCSARFPVYGRSKAVRGISQCFLDRTRTPLADSNIFTRG